MKRFKKVYLEITNICNLQCDFCPETKRPRETLSIGNFSKILDQIQPFTNHVYFHIKGEPLLHPNIDKFLDISYEKGFNINITSNGTLLSQKKESLFNKPALRQINLSLHSLGGNDYSKCEEYLEDVLSVVREFRKKTEVIMSLRLWNLEDGTNKDIEKNKILLEAIEREFDLDYKITDLIKPERGIKLGEKTYLNQDYRFTWPSLEEEEDEGEGFCYGLRDQIGILVDGTVVPCCLDGEGIINLGNIFEKDFKEIIESDRARGIYDGFSRRMAVEELCRKCGFRRKFS